MNIPEGYRKLEKGEAILASDIYRRGDRFAPQENKEMLPVSETNPSYIGEIFGEAGYREDGRFDILRKQDSPWVSMKKRKPCGADFDKRGFVLCFVDGSYTDVGTNGSGNLLNATHWMKIPKPPKEIPPPITILEGTQEREIEFREDGSLKVGCVEVSSEKFEEILLRRGQVMKRP